MCKKQQYSRQTAQEVLEDFLRFMDLDKKLHFRALIAPKVRAYINWKYQIQTYQSKQNAKATQSV